MLKIAVVEIRRDVAKILDSLTGNQKQVIYLFHFVLHVFMRHFVAVPHKLYLAVYIISRNYTQMRC